MKLFVLCHSVLQFSMTLYSSYFLSCITTVEQRFGFSSTSIEAITSLPDVCSIVVVFLCYFGRRDHRPHLLGLGGLIMSFSTACLSLLHFSSDNYDYHSLSADVSGLGTMCIPRDHLTGPPVCYQSSNSSMESGPVQLVACEIFFGIDATPVTPFGISYIDDYAEPENAALYIGNFGYILGSLMFRFFVDVDRIDNPKDLMPPDPRWVGAWWMGMLVSSGCLALFFIPFFFFPQNKIQTPKTDSDSSKGNHKKSESQSWINSVKRAVNTPLFALGMQLGGLVMKWVRPFVKIIPWVCTLILFLSVVLIVPLFFMDCSTQKVAGVNRGYGSMQLDQSLALCNSNCSCVSDVYSPVCGEDGTEFISPCHAGCTNVTVDPHNPHRVQMMNANCFFFGLTIAYKALGIPLLSLVGWRKQHTPQH
ncbi:solute carrier organic anion transporter family member 2A1-like [Diretmus argenteus]